MNRLTIAQYVGIAIVIVMLETHAVSRPVTFLLGPYIIWVCMIVTAPPELRRRWPLALLIAAILSVLGFALTRYVFTRG